MSFGISAHYFVGEIDEKDKNKLKASAQKISMRRCQEWTVAVLRDLEGKGLVAAGTGDYWFNQVENSPYSTDGYHHTQPTERHGSSGSTSGSSSDWVWDENHQRYRRWDSSAKRWVWRA